MFLQGAAIWHPRCGPGPDESMATSVNLNGSGFHHHGHDSGYDRNSTVSEQPYGSRASSPGASLRRPFTPGGMFPSSASTAGDGRVSRSASTHGGYGIGFNAGALYHSSSTYSLRRPIEPGDKNGSSSHLPQFHLPASRQRRSSSQAAAASHMARFGGRTSAMEYPPVSTSRPSSRPGSRPGSSAGYRPISAPPKPGYTQAKSATLPTTPVSQVPPYRTTLHSPYGLDGGLDGRTSAASFASSNAMMTPDMNHSRTYTAGFQHFQHSTPSHPKPLKDHKIYPLHLLLTSNFKMPPDVDRCNLEKHLNDEDFEMVFHMPRDDFYSLPLWRRNDFKRRVRLF